LKKVLTPTKERYNQVIKRIVILFPTIAAPFVAHANVTCSGIPERVYAGLTWSRLLPAPYENALELPSAWLGVSAQLNVNRSFPKCISQLRVSVRGILLRTF
jgi:hypothetical protein